MIELRWRASRATIDPPKFSSYQTLGLRPGAWYCAAHEKVVWIDASYLVWEGQWVPRRNADDVKKLKAQAFQALRKQRLESPVKSEDDKWDEFVALTEHLKQQENSFVGAVFLSLTSRLARLGRIVAHKWWGNP